MLEDVTQIMATVDVPDGWRESLFSALILQTPADYGPATKDAFELDPQTLHPDRMIPYDHGNLKEGFCFSDPLTEVFLTILYVYRYKGLPKNRLYHMLKTMIEDYQEGMRRGQSKYDSHLYQLFKTKEDVLIWARGYNPETATSTVDGKTLEDFTRRLASSLDSDRQYSTLRSNIQRKIITQLLKNIYILSSQYVVTNAELLSKPGLLLSGTLEDALPSLTLGPQAIEITSRKSHIVDLIRDRCSAEIHSIDLESHAQALPQGLTPFESNLINSGLLRKARVVIDAAGLYKDIALVAEHWAKPKPNT